MSNEPTKAELQAENEALRREILELQQDRASDDDRFRALEQRFDALEKNQNDRNREEIERLHKRLDSSEKTAFEKHQEFVKEQEALWRDERTREEQAVVEKLVEGDKLFLVKIEGNPERLVGANSRDEAEGKYKRFFRINATLITPKVEEVTDKLEFEPDRLTAATAVREV